MCVLVSENEFHATHKSRKLRLQILIEHIKTNKELTVDDVIRFAMNRWFLSRAIISTYIEDIIATDQFKIETRPEGDFIIYVGEGE